MSCSSCRSGRSVWLAIVLTGVFGVLPARGEDKTPPSASSLDAETRTRVVESFNRWAAAIHSLSAGGKARVGAEGEKTRVFQFSLLLSRPGNARVQGRWGGLATLFDLSGDGKGWTLYLPQDRVVVRSRPDAQSAGLLVPPRELLAVLLPTGIPPKDMDQEGAASLESGLARLVVPPGKGGAGSALHRVLWLDSESGTPRRMEIRRSSQLEAPVLIAKYEHYEEGGRFSIPGEISVEFPETSQWARFDLETTRVNTAVESKSFSINIPTGTREVPADELTPDFLPEAEDQK
ncbi:MAG TPA: hypothetical protein VFP10_09150 [Candidatus Eisenbacteria bacterium]|nr:hypothetical protein [Candidatus Eisenbacteria bacterium]